MGCHPNTERRAAVMQLLDTGMTPTQVGKMLGVSANAVYNIRRKVCGPARPPERQPPVEPSCPRCGLRGSHQCLTAASIYWQPRTAR